MLELKIKASNDIDADGKRVFLTDDTGLYTASNNPGGYGKTNPLRDTLAIYPIGYLNKANGDKVPLDFEPYNPLTSVKWTALPKTDGWLSFDLVYAPVVETPLIEDYTEGQFVFSSSEFELLQVVADPKSLVLEFKSVDPTLLLEDNSSKTLDQLFLANLSFTKINLNQRKIELLIDSENLSNSKRIAIIQRAYDEVRSIIQGSIYQFCIGNKYVAQRYVEFLLTNNYDQL